MNRTITAREIAKEMKVSHVTAYGWLRAGRIKCREFQSGERKSYEVFTEDFESFRELMAANSEAKKTSETNPDRDGKQWFSDYCDIFGHYPAEYSGFLKGKITVEMAASELERRIELATKRLHLYKSVSKV